MFREKAGGWALYWNFITETIPQLVLTIQRLYQSIQFCLLQKTCALQGHALPRFSIILLQPYLAPQQQRESMRKMLECRLFNTITDEEKISEVLSSEESLTLVLKKYLRLLVSQLLQVHL